MELVWLPKDPDSNVHKFVSRAPAWKPGKGLPWTKVTVPNDRSRPRTFGPGAFGGHVYAQAPLAAAKVMEKVDEKTPPTSKLGIHVSWFQQGESEFNVKLEIN